MTDDELREECEWRSKYPSYPSPAPVKGEIDWWCWFGFHQYKKLSQLQTDRDYGYKFQESSCIKCNKYKRFYL